MIRVTSEIGRLEKVLVHEPGSEVDQMVPSMMEELLFDDILFGDRARDEHRRFRRVLQLLGVSVVDASDLLAAILEGAEVRAWLSGLLLEEIPRRLRDRVGELPAADLATLLVSGVRSDNLQPGEEVEDLFEVTPLPNWCFQRDPQIVLGSGVVFAAMATPARNREGLLARAIFRFHPELQGVSILHDPLEPPRDQPLFAGAHRPRIEGGDVLVLSPDVIAVGHSERTNMTGVHLLSRALARREDGPRWLVIVELPQRRAFMHLDTLITPVDRDACLAHVPVIVHGGPSQARVYEVDLHAADPVPVPREGLLPTLARRGIDMEPIPCGGKDPLAQQREQWSDGANALAVAPGVILLYDRNACTAEELSYRGFRVVGARDLLLGREEVDLETPRRTCILLESNEISRARGGPHCLSHPLHRRDLR